MYLTEFHLNFSHSPTKVLIEKKIENTIFSEDIILFLSIAALPIKSN